MNQQSMLLKSYYITLSLHCSVTIWFSPVLTQTGGTKICKVGFNLINMYLALKMSKATEMVVINRQNVKNTVCLA